MYTPLSKTGISVYTPLSKTDPGRFSGLVEIFVGKSLLFSILCKHATVKQITDASPDVSLIVFGEFF